MSFVPAIRDELVTDLVYRHLPSWPAVGCYFAWREQYAAKRRDEAFAKAKESRGGRSLQRAGAVLTDDGWVIPTGQHNPRIIDQAGTELMSPADIAKQQAVDDEVGRIREDHEVAVLDRDLFNFARQWQHVVQGDGWDELELRDTGADRSEQREAFMARWHAQDHPH